jgi:hypothetical protein
LSSEQSSADKFHNSQKLMWPLPDELLSHLHKNDAGGTKDESFENRSKSGGSMLILSAYYKGSINKKHLIKGKVNTYNKLFQNQTKDHLILREFSLLNFVQFQIILLSLTSLYTIFYLFAKNVLD